MNFDEIIQELDRLYDKDLMEEAYSFLISKIQEAISNQENLIIVALLSELVSHCRVTAKFEEGNKLASQLLNLIQVFDLKETIHEATATLNIATFYRVQGRYIDSLALYQRCNELYQFLLEEDDERVVSFYNNFALLYQEINQLDKAIIYSLKALEKQRDENKRGITYTNLSQMYYQNQQEELGNIALENAFVCFQKANYPDSHYLAAYSMKADQAYRNNNKEEAIQLYQYVLDGIEKIYGKNKDYETILDNINRIKNETHHIKGLELCRRFYREYGEKMIDTYFKDYKSYMCIGLFGYGSDALGYDDSTSKDHDFGPGFLILLPDDIYEIIGEKLQNRYDQLPDTYLGHTRKVYKKNRVGVARINEFFEQFISFPIDYYNLEDYDLLCCINGKIFDDYLGEVTRIRKELQYYPSKVHQVKLAQVLVKVSQTGQYNYPRMKARNELEALACLHEFIDYSIHAYYLLKKKYEPYYKWKLKGIEEGKFKQAILSLYQNKDIELNIQIICDLLILEVKKETSIEMDSIFVEDYGNYIMEELNND